MSTWFSKHRSLQRDFSFFLLLKPVIKLLVAKECRKEMGGMTLGINSSLGALRTEAARGWELCLPENFPELNKLAHFKSKSPTPHPTPNHHSAAHPEHLPSICLSATPCSSGFANPKPDLSLILCRIVHQGHLCPRDVEAQQVDGDDSSITFI